MFFILVNSNTLNLNVNDDTGFIKILVFLAHT